MPFPSLNADLLHAVRSGLDGAAVLSPAGEPLDVVGALDRHEVRALAALVSKQGPANVLGRLFCPGALDRLPDRTVYLGIAGRCVFVVAIAGPAPAAARQAMGQLCRSIDAIVSQARGNSLDTWHPPPGGASGNGSPPAQAFVFPPARGATRKPN